MRAIILALCLTGCASQAIVHDIKTVNVPVQVACVDKIPESPKLHTDAELKAMGDYELVITLLQDRIARMIYESQLEAVLSGCVNKITN